MNISIKQIYEKIKEYECIILTGHKYPDGDALGALVSFKRIIEKSLNKKCYIVIDHELPSLVNILNAPKIYKSVYDIENFSFDNSLHISLDTANYDRIAMKVDEIEKFKENINIDHHISNDRYFKYNYIQDISSVSELMYQFLLEFNVNLDEEIAKWIYLGIINYTGNFRHSNVTKNTFVVASKLIETGIDISNIYFSLYQKSIKKARAFGKAMQEAKYIEKYNFMYYFIPYTEIVDNNYISEDTDGISELLLGIEGVSVSLFLREAEEGYLKGSLRSKSDIDVNKIASMFSGGGHVKASGFRIKLDVKEIIEKIITYLEINK